MSKLSNVTKITTAHQAVSNHVLDCQHITTANWMELNVAKYIELVPKQSVDIFHQLWSRLEPISVPTFGRGNIHKTAIFVPYRTIFPAWNDFITDVPHVYSDGTIGIPTSVPLISSSTFLNFFTSSTIANVVQTDAFDFELISNASTKIKYKFTPRGRLAYKQFLSLGYRLNFNWLESVTMFSALPLFSLAKAYLDWYYPSQYAQDGQFGRIEKWLTYDGRNFTTEFNAAELGLFFDMFSHVNYTSDYFVNAWDNPSAPNDGTASSVSINDIDVSNTGGSSSYDRNDQQAILSAPNGVISQFMLTALRSLSDFLQRNKIVGARALDRYLARYGITLSAEKLKRSVLLNRTLQELDFGDVTSTADTEGAPLGAYAGKGLSYGKEGVSYSATEYGMLLILSSIVPVVSYSQGIDRTTLHVSRLDFFQPEFDNLGVQALSSAEVYVPQNASDLYPESYTSYSNQTYKNKVFGFVPRYAEYKVPRDLVSGDYVLGSRNVGKDAWTLYRNLDALFKNKGGNAVVHDVDFVKGLDYRQYDRIFHNVSDNADKFNIIHNFKITSRFPGKSLWDTYEFENDDEGQKVNVSVGGTEIN